MIRDRLVYMRGDDRQQPALFLYGTLEQRIPEKSPLRPVRAMADAALEALSSRFDEMYSKNGRPSIAPEKLLLALLLLSDEHFTVDGTLIEAWASQKSFRPKDGSDDSGEGGFRGQKRRNDTHRSTTTPEAKLYQKSNRQEAKLSYRGRMLIDNRHGLVVNAAPAMA